MSWEQTLLRHRWLAQNTTIPGVKRHHEKMIRMIERRLKAARRKGLILQ